MLMTIQFKRQLFKTGDSICLTIPEELRNYLNLELGDQIIIQPEQGKKGKYISIWKKEEEK